MTTYGTAVSARRFLAHAGHLSPRWVFTPGNAELRSAGALRVLAGPSACKSLVIEGIHFLLPDTSTGRIPAAERAWVAGAVPCTGPCVVLTHYAVDVLEAESRAWIETWLQDHPVELYVAGHRHVTRTRRLGGCLEIVTRGLDPDKAHGGPPGITLLERDPDGGWSEQAIPWPHAMDLFPPDVEHASVGWSIHGDPAAAASMTLACGLGVLELRPRGPVYDLAATVEGVRRLRQTRPVYLSWHLPGLSWDAAAATVTGQAAAARQVDHARQCGVQALTVHVPQVGAHLMDPGGKVWQAFVRAFASLFSSALDGGVRLSIENVHNAPGTPLAREQRRFATQIEEYETWLDAVDAALGTVRGSVGAHLDIGHARNNGESGNLQPLGDWYACIGRRITGYHVHQVRPHEETGVLTNHRDVKSIYDRTISYAGFVHAWSRGLINRAPIFVEVRDAEERRRTTTLFQRLFALPRGPV